MDLEFENGLMILANDIHYEAEKNYVPFHNIEYINCSETISLLSNLNLDLVFTRKLYISESLQNPQIW